MWILYYSLLHEHTTAPISINQLLSSVNTTDPCVSQNSLPDLKLILRSVDLREANLSTAAKSQLNCSASHVFAATALLENTILRLSSKSAFWANQSTLLNLSEQFLLSNQQYKFGYCEFGDFSNVINSIENLKLNTTELTENIPFKPLTNELNWTQNITLAPVLAAENYLLPYKLLTVSSDECPFQFVPVIRIFENQLQAFDQVAINTVKSYLSRGIAVVGGMKISGEPGNKFNYYSGGGQVLTGICDSFARNHQMLFVGYGKKNGKNVWVLKNSFGAQWGDKGHFFLEIGANSFCSEQYAFTMVPVDFNMNEKLAYTGFVKNRGHQWSLDCDTYYTFIDGVMTCVLTCPDSLPYVEASNQCVARCSSGFYDNITCVDSCNLYLFNASNGNSRQCIQACAADVPYYEPGKCVVRCSSGAYNSIFVCVESCKLFVLNASNQFSQQCLESCPSNAPFIDSKQCLPRCPYNAYISGTFVCQPSCLNYYIVNKTDFSHECVNKCDLFIDGKECVNNCTNVSTNQVCTDKCVLPTIYQNNLTCVDKCEYYQGEKCVQSCNRYIVNNSMKICVEECNWQEKSYDGECKHVKSPLALAVTLPIIFFLLILAGVIVFIMYKKQATTKSTLALPKAQSKKPSTKPMKTASPKIDIKKKKKSANVQTIPVTPKIQAAQSLPQETTQSIVYSGISFM
ncbi:Cathepsin_L [Hexamita inflata]|uniref:Cathepsin L n=1 Tax=Hexamita inflata TaxID=28002 RepID=A0AA86PL16_9EUKA|nr:Cathepsin L [Hexamita inflata]